MRVEPFRLGKSDSGRRQQPQLLGPSFRTDVRFMKSSTERPDENRAERAVGSTWFEPPT